MERSALGGDFTGAREGFEGGIGGLLDHPRFIHGMEREKGGSTRVEGTSVGYDVRINVSNP